MGSSEYKEYISGHLAERAQIKTIKENPWEKESKLDSNEVNRVMKKMIAL